MAQSVKRGVWQAGETGSSSRPWRSAACAATAMLYRNLLAIEAEELMRADPLDGVVLSGCDKTTPGC